MQASTRRSMQESSRGRDSTTAQNIRAWRLMIRLWPLHLHVEIRGPERLSIRPRISGITAATQPELPAVDKLLRAQLEFMRR